MSLFEAEVGKEYTVESIEIDDKALLSFLFSLGCYSGEPITLVHKRKGGCVVSVKDGRYNLDKALASAIILK
jgi:ferrous iron transport protein A